MHKMADAYKEKAKTQAHLHKVYTQLKAQVLAGQFASAASDDAEATLQSATGDRFIDRLTGPAAGHQRFPAGRNVIRLESRRRSNGSAGGGDGWRRSQPHARSSHSNNDRLFSSRTYQASKLLIKIRAHLLQTMPLLVRRLSTALVLVT